MLRNFRFIVENELAGMAHPEQWGCSLPDALYELKELGISAVVSLDEEGLDPDELRHQGMAYLHLPIPDFTAPSIGQAEEFVDFVQKNVEQEHPVVCHCMAGIGRTGTMLACYLVSRGMDPQSAIETVRRAPYGGIETQTQEYFINSYAAHLRQAQLRDTSSARK
ncbi:dual specificity protein phosphatase family protein [Candidatus Sumerlaeota bacterium]|nr:dual specificity protein phosphatase family protein [Candidatus Sumerlaeota bacterium]